MYITARIEDSEFYHSLLWAQGKEQQLYIFVPEIYIYNLSWDGLLLRFSFEISVCIGPVISTTLFRGMYIISWINYRHKQNICIIWFCREKRLSRRPLGLLGEERKRWPKLDNIIVSAVHLQSCTTFWVSKRNLHAWLKSLSKL